MIRIIRHSLREYKTPAIITMVLVIIEGILECMIPFTIAQLITGVRASDMAIIQSYGIRLVLLALCSLLMGAGAGFASADAVTGLSRNLRKDMFARIQDFSFENIELLLVFDFHRFRLYFHYNIPIVLIWFGFVLPHLLLNHIWIKLLLHYFLEIYRQ